MYFSEQGNVDDDATLITIFLVSFNLQSCCLMQSAVCSLWSAVCSLQMSYTAEDVGRNTQLRLVFPPTLLSCSSRFVINILQHN